MTRLARIVLDVYFSVVALPAYVAHRMSDIPVCDMHVWCL